MQPDGGEIDLTTDAASSSQRTTPSGLSAVTIVGIIIGILLSLVLAVAIAVIVLYVVRRRNTEGKDSVGRMANRKVSGLGKHACLQ